MQTLQTFYSRKKRRHPLPSPEERTRKLADRGTYTREPVPGKSVVFYQGATYRYRKGKRKYEGRLISIFEKSSTSRASNLYFRPDNMTTEEIYGALPERKVTASLWANIAISKGGSINVPLRKLIPLTPRKILEAKLCDDVSEIQVVMPGT